MMNREDVVVSWIEQVAEVPAALKPLVGAYNVRKEIAENCAAYPKVVDDEMNVLFDAMLVLAKDCGEVTN